jgi:processive 1,2-diacylglycerol beta-glucosyltransferase
MKKVLILTAGFGEGHNAAARNLRDALELASDEVKVEVLDLLEISYGRLNTLVKSTYFKVVDYAPFVWSGIYGWLDSSMWPNPDGVVGLARLREHLSDILRTAEPDCVVTTYPLYSPLIQMLYRDHSERPFQLISVVTDSITANSMWWRSPCDYWIVSNEQTAQVLREGGVDADKIQVLGFPVSPRFADLASFEIEPPEGTAWRKVLVAVNHNRKKVSRTIEELLELPRIQLTVTVGRDAELKAELAEKTRKHADRVTLLGWTNVMPRLLVESHLLVAKAGGAILQEAIAARCPMIVNHVIPGHEEGNARLIADHGLGAVADRRRDIAGLVEDAFAHRARQWHQWRKNLVGFSKPDGALRLAELVLDSCEHPEARPRTSRLFSTPSLGFQPSSPRACASGSSEDKMLLCDLHTHSNYSDGKLTVPELVDFYGSRGFDCLCVTDHLADPRRLLGKLTGLTNLVLSPNQLEEYFDVIDRERKRAWRKYSMLLMTGIEFNKDGLTSKSSAHLLGIDLKAPIDPALDLADTIAAIHDQQGLAVASHPHVMKTEWGKNTLYLWENQERYAPLLDAWEIANRNNIFTPIGLKGLPFIANSDFHKPKHIESWKTLLRCEKHPDAIKHCIRENRRVAITFYHDDKGTELATSRIQKAPLSLPKAHAAVGLLSAGA